MSVYSSLSFPPPPEDRPYCYVNMVTTIDGKILSGGREEDVLDLGSKADHAAMKSLERRSDGVIVGAQTLRASPIAWKPAARFSIVVTHSGDLPESAGFFKVEFPFIATTTKADFEPPAGVSLLREGYETVDLAKLYKGLRQDLGIHHLLVLGGSELNAQLIEANLIDELFVTIAPKVKLGRDVPTYADGQSLSRENLQRYRLLEHHVIGDEIFTRYRREGTTFDAPHSSP